MTEVGTIGRTDIVVIGAGFAGLYMLHRARASGFSIKGFEAGRDVGGTWFWNRYPGARCDVESIDYSFSFDPDLEQEWDWSERFATQPEILAYLQHVADRHDLRRLIEFETRIVSATWDEGARRWTVATDTGENWSAQYLVCATGSLSAAKAPDIEGLDEFAGEILLTSAWPTGKVDLSGKNVGVIGTGSSAIQVIPPVAGEAATLTVFQRTASYTVPAHNRPLDPEYYADIKSRYREHRRSCADEWQGVMFHSTGKKALDVSHEEREYLYEASWQRGGPSFGATFVDVINDSEANRTAADFAHRKIRSIVQDPETAERLIPKGFPFGTKRLAVDTNYYATFNRENVSLVDLRAEPIEVITKTGIRTTAGDYPLDTLILATGFDAMTGSFLRIGAVGVGGISLAEKWNAGPTTYLGLMVADFPNMFVVAGPGSPSVFTNMVHSIEQHVEWIDACLVAMREQGYTRIEAEQTAEAAWVDRVNQMATKTLHLQGNSWYLGANVPGKPRVFMPFLGGVPLYREICNAAVADGYRGFARS